MDGSNDPTPSSSYDNHGTRCAGVVAMEKSNNYCGVGVAHQATLTGTFCSRRFMKPSEIIFISMQVSPLI